MHEMQPIVTDLCIVCLSVWMSDCSSVCLSHGRSTRFHCVGGHSMWPLPNHFGLLLLLCFLVFRIAYCTAGPTRSELVTSAIASLIDRLINV